MGSGSEDGDDKRDAEHGEDGNESSANGIDDDEPMVRLAGIFQNGSNIDNGQVSDHTPEPSPGEKNSTLSYHSVVYKPSG